MNDPLIHTDQLNYRGRNLSNWMLIIISGLLCFGALMVFSAGASVDREFQWSNCWQYITVRRVLFVPIVWIVLAIVSRLNYRKFLVWNRFFWVSPLIWALLISIGLLVLVLLVGEELCGSKRWLKIGPIKMQPSELAKWTTIMFIAAFAARRDEKINRFWTSYVPACSILLLVAALIGYEDLGTGALVAVVGLAVLFIAGMRWWHPLTLLPLIAAGGYFLIFKVPYRWARVMAFISGEQSGFEETRYHAEQSIMAIGSGGLWGAGLGTGRIKLGWLPEDTTDFIFAVIGEELGFFGCTLVIFLYLSLLLACTQAVIRCRDRLGKLLVLAIGSTIVTQAVINLFVVTRMAPTKGIALPYISAGGSGLLVTAFATGVMLNVARRMDFDLPALENQS